ncbi:hypothetical protein CPB85DRAFT_1253581 [Mucidula mucida]|nr:hypothetical protein CPB85DRAFT_1253581 [Mucidula mucida]
MAASTLYTGGIFLSFETHLLSLGTLKLGSGSVIVLSSAATVKELLNKRSLQSIDRPANYLIVHMVTNDLNLGFPPHVLIKPHQPILNLRHDFHHGRAARTQVRERIHEDVLRVPRALDGVSHAWGLVHPHDQHACRLKAVRIRRRLASNRLFWLWSAIRRRNAKRRRKWTMLLGTNERLSSLTMRIFPMSGRFYKQYAMKIFELERYLRSLHGTKEGFHDTDFRNNFQFGAGRRICPGQVLANNAIAINAMNMIWAFDFAPTTDGNPYDIENCLSSFTCITRPYKCSITPCSESQRRLIRQQFADAATVFQRF